MISRQKQASQVWIEMMDRDLEALIRGDKPLNADLAPLSSFLDGLERYGSSTPSREVINAHAETTGAIVRARRASSIQATGQIARTTPLSWRIRLRNRTTAIATSVLMVGGMTGVAWAADHAAPGDFLYGIDRALEVVGIGAGGAEERLAELTSSAQPPSPQDLGDSPHDPLTEANTAGAHNSTSIGSGTVPAGAAAIHDYLDSTAVTEGLSVAEIAKLVAARNLEDVGKPENAGKPESPSRSDSAGRPESAGKP